MVKRIGGKLHNIQLKSHLLFLPDSVSGVHICIKAFVVHVPQNTNGLLSLGLTLKNCVLRDQSRLRAFLDLKGRGS